MAELLKRGQGWKTQPKAGGAETEDIKGSRERKRYMRLLGAGDDPKESRDIAADQERYRKWVLTERHGNPEEKAEAVLRQGDQAYKQLRDQVRDSLGPSRSLRAKIGLVFGCHLPYTASRMLAGRRGVDDAVASMLQ